MDDAPLIQSEIEFLSTRKTNTTDAQDGHTRKQRIVQTWVEVKRIDSLESADKIDRLTSQPSERLDLRIDDFEDRALCSKMFVPEFRS